MGKSDRRIGVFMDKAARWQDEMRRLRAILLDTPLDEAFKWRSPCYTWKGANLVTIWGLRDHCGLGFFKGALLKDPKGVLQAPGEHSRATRVMRFTGLAQIDAAEPVIRAYVDEAIAAEEAGAKITFAKDDLAYPDELTDRLDADPELREAFDALTPGRRRGWVLHVTRAKKSATRAARIEAARPAILQGRGMHDH